MPSKVDPVKLLQARSRLREELPVRPCEPGGKVHFNHISLDGYLFAIVASPIEIGPDVWGWELERYLPDDCYDDDEYYEDILLLYASMQDVLAQKQSFRVHSLNLPESIPPGEKDTHPLNDWITGFATGYSLVLRELERLANRKKNKKKPEIRTIIQEYKDHAALFYGGLTLRMNPDAPRSADPDFAEIQKHVHSQPLRVFFDNAVEMMCVAAEIAATRLERVPCNP